MKFVAQNHSPPPHSTHAQRHDISLFLKRNENSNSIVYLNNREVVRIMMFYRDWTHRRKNETESKKKFEIS